VPEAVLPARKSTFDLALSHGVLMYTPDPLAHLQVLHDEVRPGGLVSILTKGKDGARERLIRQGDEAAVRQLNVSDRLTNRLKEDVLAVTPESMQVMLGQAGLRLVDWYGVRIKSDEDFRPITEVTELEMADIIGEEVRLSSDENLRHMGQMLHFIATREDT
jgi:SAM-dependent methyltransferase